MNILQIFLVKKIWQTLYWFFYWTIYFTFLVRNKPSPVVRIPANIVKVLPEGGENVLQVPLGTKPIWITDVAPTRSMDAWLDQGDKIILQKSNGNDVQIGDVIVYAKNNDESNMIIHQIVAESSDSEGHYFVLKGLNNPLPDRSRVRPSWIRWVMLGVLY